MTELALKFLSNEAGEQEGLGDAGIETFRDAPYASCAREAGQNSRDAATNSPVRMTFNVLHLEQTRIPCNDDLKRSTDICLKEAKQDREKEFFRTATEILSRPRIPVLQIADYNTTGLLGPPNEPGTPFHSLVKASGVTAKEAVDSGGSFGIGKNASFAISDLQTVFYTTVYRAPDTGASMFAAQGKVKLVSHLDHQGRPCRAVGYWGHPDGFLAVTDSRQVPDWMSRKEIGTSIFCIGFREADDWAERMTYSLISNFFCAVYRKEMEFEVDSGRIQVNQNTLEALLKRQDIQDAAERIGHKADLLFAEQLYRCLISDKAEERHLHVPGLGKVKVRILIEDGMPRRIGFIRNGMLITDSLRHFGHALARFPSSRDFVMLVEPGEKDASVALKRLENPAHDGFSAERISDSAKRKNAAAAMKQLGRELRSIIRDAAGVRHEGAILLEELGRFFGEAGPPSNAPSLGAETDPETVRYSPQPPRKQRATVCRGANGNQGGSALTGKGRSRNGGGTGPGKGAGTGGSGKRGVENSVTLRDVRNLLQKNKDGVALARLLHFTPTLSGSIELAIRAVGVDQGQELIIAGSDKGSVISGKLVIDVREDRRCSAHVTLKEPYDGPIELSAIENVVV